ncbi:MAG TPA: hypothetical protein VM183_14195 [Burkholderiales bacterium]|nr:hypothetical protein [Burkholderiales bacterium]
MTAELLAAYLKAAAFGLLAVYNAYLAYEMRGKRRIVFLASLTAVILGVLAWHSWPV